MTNEPTHKFMALFVLHKLILQTRMPSHPVGIDVWFLVGPFIYFHTSCVRTAKALAWLRGCTVSPELPVAYVISTIISWAGSNIGEGLYVTGWSRGLVVQSAVSKLAQCVTAVLGSSPNQTIWHITPLWNLVAQNDSAPWCCMYQKTFFYYYSPIPFTSCTYAFTSDVPIIFSFSYS